MLTDLQVDQSDSYSSATGGRSDLSDSQLLNGIAATRRAIPDKLRACLRERLAELYPDTSNPGRSAKNSRRLTIVGGSIEGNALSKAQNSNANMQTALNFCADSRSAPRRACHPKGFLAARHKRQNAPLRRLSAHERVQFERNVQRFSEEAVEMASAADEAAWADLTHFRHQQLSAVVKQGADSTTVEVCRAAVRQVTEMHRQRVEQSLAEKTPVTRETAKRKRECEVDDEADQSERDSDDVTMLIAAFQQVEFVNLKCAFLPTSLPHQFVLSGKHHPQCTRSN